MIAASPVAGVYEKAVDRESAYEKLKARAAASPPAAASAGAGAGRQRGGGGMMGGLKDILFGSTGPRGGRREGMVDAMAKTRGHARRARRSRAKSCAACWDRCSGKRR